MAPYSHLWPTKADWEIALKTIPTAPRTHLTYWQFTSSIRGFHELYLERRADYGRVRKMRALMRSRKPRLTKGCMQ